MNTTPPPSFLPRPHFAIAVALVAAITAPVLAMTYHAPTAAASPPGTPTTQWNWITYGQDDARPSQAVAILVPYAGAEPAGPGDSVSSDDYLLLPTYAKLSSSLTYDPEFNGPVITGGGAQASDHGTGDVAMPFNGTLDFKVRATGYTGQNVDDMPPGAGHLTLVLKKNGVTVQSLSWASSAWVTKSFNTVTFARNDTLRVETTLSVDASATEFASSNGTHAAGISLWARFFTFST